MNTPFLQLDHVSKYYRSSIHGFRVVEDVSLEVKRGEIVALVGPSGCGKTSVLRMIAGFETVSSGSIVLMGRQIQNLSPAKRNIAMAFEGYCLYPPLTVRENIIFSLQAGRFPQSDIDHRLAEISKLLELDQILDDYPRTLSGGQQQRVSLARALVRDADLYLLDEPMGQLEPQLRAILRGRLRHFMKQRGSTAILVTHDQVEANALADRIAVMEAGSLQQFDYPDIIKERPRNLFVAGFIGEPPMNMFLVTLIKRKEMIDFCFADDTRLGYALRCFSTELCQAFETCSGLILGIRPQAIALENAPAKNVISAKVTANHWLGDQSHLAANFAGGTIIFIENNYSALQAGACVTLRMNQQAFHFFDLITKQRLGCGLQGLKT